MLHILSHTILDSIKLIPFLFITYLLMEYIEHKTSSKTKEKIKKSGKYGPIIGGILRNISTMWILGICDKFICSKSGYTRYINFSLSNYI